MANGKLATRGKVEVIFGLGMTYMVLLAEGGGRASPTVWVGDPNTPFRADLPPLSSPVATGLVRLPFWLG